MKGAPPPQRGGVWKLLAKCGCCFTCARDSSSAGGSEGSLSTSVASLPPRASGSSTPASPGSKRSVSTLKKWLADPVRKLSPGPAKGQRPVRRLEGEAPTGPLRSHSRDPGCRDHSRDPELVLPIAHRDLAWREVLASPEDLSPATLHSPLLGCTLTPTTQ
ncbi:hypothetical protein CRUP_012108, partial [Coryphaenoides rupestris]